MYDKVKRASKEDLQPDVVEEKGVEDAAQLLSLVDVPQDESLAEVVAARLLQLPHVQIALQLAPDDKMFLDSRPPYAQG